MESLSMEVLLMVLCYALQPQGNDLRAPIAPYATVNRRWQAVIEECTFGSIRIYTATRLKEFQRLFGKLPKNSHRKFCIQKIDLLVELEPYDKKANAHYETDEENQRNNKIFRTAISSLFEVLASWPDNVELELIIEAQSPSDDLACKDPEVFLQRIQAARSRGGDVLGDRYNRRYLKFFEESGHTPSIHAVTTLQIKGTSGRRLIEPASCALIASKLPRLFHLDLNLVDECKRDEGLRKQLRDDFAIALRRVPPNIQGLCLKFAYNPPRDHNYPPPILAEGETDLLSTHLREVSRNLSYLNIESTVIGPELFWPLNSQDKSSGLPSWPHLTSFVVGYAPVTPFGQWLFERPSESLEDDVEANEGANGVDEREWQPGFPWTAPEDRKINNFRTNTIMRFANNLYMSAGQAALQMPKLESMTLATAGSHNPRQVFKYTVANGVAKLTWSHVDFIGLFLLKYQVGWAGLRRVIEWFQPDEQVLELWKKVAFQHTGGELQIYFVDSKNTELGNLL
ncbi:hypothetical protein PENANT_c017G06314 [Penicillium antarcticum]|uniref:DUF6546 domain-containing protein n=1 Tax=Penicillium antarcticum TaxID=416450 RepID=A0A1V6Q2F3_9EURO|nr:hypothetical protein PENANT_c017G06314 [Penicillium antarcticum]